MKITRALVVTPLVPLVGVAMVGLALGARSVAEVAGFVLMWAIFIVPLTLVLVAVALALNRKCGPCSRLQFALGGLVVGAAICGAWIQPWTADRPLRAIAIVAAVGGVFGAATALTAWCLAVRGRTV
jgi:hypothetical protein